VAIDIRYFQTMFSRQFPGHGSGVCIHLVNNKMGGYPGGCRCWRSGTIGNRRHDNGKEQQGKQQAQVHSVIFIFFFKKYPSISSGNNPAYMRAEKGSIPFKTPGLPAVCHSMVPVFKGTDSFSV
jgi:hypothetical protein